MTAPAIETSRLTKDFGQGRGVFDITLSVEQGSLFGFLGPNGAGKTTFMRMLVGLVRPSSGHASVSGAPAGSLEATRAMGALIESPSLYPHLTGRENLRYLALLNGIGDDRVTEVLEQVDLLSSSAVRFGSYSLGMKQRLGVAAALLTRPSVLLLDEPTNGLDAQGLVDMRDMLTGLTRAGTTVFLSSHQMNEVAALCDRVAIVRAGRLVMEDTVDAITRRYDRRRYLVDTEQTARALDVAGRSGLVTESGTTPTGVWLRLDETDASALLAQMIRADVAVTRFTSDGQSLEQAFLDVVGDTVGEQHDTLTEAWTK